MVPVASRGCPHFAAECHFFGAAVPSGAFPSKALRQRCWVGKRDADLCEMHPAGSETTREVHPVDSEIIDALRLLAVQLVQKKRGRATAAQW